MACGPGTHLLKLSFVVCYVFHVSFKPENVVRTALAVRDILVYSLYSCMLRYTLKVIQQMFGYGQVLSNLAYESYSLMFLL